VVIVSLVNNEVLATIKFEDIVFSKSVFVKTKEMYSLSLDILDNMAVFGTIIEKKHQFETDGPRKQVHLFFDTVDKIDERSSLIFSFMINGNSNGTGYLDIDFKGMFSVKVPPRNGFGSEAFNSFYVNKLFPSMRKDMDSKIKGMGKFIEKKIETLNFKYA